jgi:hypothetical protein
MEIAMPTALRLLVVCAPLLCMSGCSWLPWFGRNIVGTPLEVVERCCFDTKMYLRAHQAWRDTVASCPEKRFSSAYADGFCHGFVDYVRRGGNGEPPAIPPMCYRYPIVRTPEQQQAIEDWFAGFRHGAAVALDQGWRNGVIIPISRPPAIDLVRFRQDIVPTAPLVPPPLDLPPPEPREELPPPTKTAPPPRPADELPPINTASMLDMPLMWLGPPVPTDDEIIMHARLRR